MDVENEDVDSAKYPDIMEHFGTGNQPREMSKRDLVGLCTFIYTWRKKVTGLEAMPLFLLFFFLLVLVILSLFLRCQDPRSPLSLFLLQCRPL